MTAKVVPPSRLARVVHLGTKFTMMRACVARSPLAVHVAVESKRKGARSNRFSFGDRIVERVTGGTASHGIGLEMAHELAQKLVLHRIRAPRFWSVSVAHGAHGKR